MTNAVHEYNLPIYMFTDKSSKNITATIKCFAKNVRKKHTTKREEQ